MSKPIKQYTEYLDINESRIQPSIEDVKTRNTLDIKKSINIIINYSSKLANWIQSNKLYFKSNKNLNTSHVLSGVVKDKSRINEVINFYIDNGGALTDQDRFYLKLISTFPFLAKKKHVDRILLAGCLVNRSGELFNIKQLCNDIITNGKRIIFTEKNTGFSKMEDTTYYLTEYILRFNGYTGCDNYTQLMIEQDTIVSDNFFNPNSIDLLIKYSEDFYKVNYKTIESRLKYIEKELDSFKVQTKEEYVNEDEVRYLKLYSELNRIYAYVKLLSYPAKLLFDYVRFLESFVKTFSSVEFITTSVKPEGRLYHISANPNLGLIPNTEYKKRSLSPRPPQTGLTQLLPPRVCFAPDPLLCCYGAPYLFMIEYNQDLLEQIRDEDGFVYYQVYLYEGIPDKNTRYIKPEYIIAEVGESMFSKEIAVVSPIKVKLIGEIEIKYRYDLDIADPRKFVSYRLVK